MKKNILIFITVLTALGLTAFSVFNFKDANLTTVEITSSEFETAEMTVEKLHVVHHNPFFEEIRDDLRANIFFGIGTPYNGIKKETLNKVRTFDDLIGEEHAQRIVSYKSLSVIILDDNEQTKMKITGNTGDFTAAQLKLLQSSDYSANLLIWADYKEKKQESGLIEESSWTPYITVIPETQAAYKAGNDALMYYLRDNSLEETNLVQNDNLQTGKLYFTVTKDGTISEARIQSTSGYIEVDNKIIELISKTTGAWVPAKNSEGEHVDQELVVTFGNMGC
ncbi:MAG: energy transducer TonB [Bacteroidia bacterium]|nr:energy transducer TonB [Bacteroidia bacterium]